MFYPRSEHHKDPLTCWEVRVLSENSKRTSLVYLCSNGGQFPLTSRSYRALIGVALLYALGTTNQNPSLLMEHCGNSPGLAKSPMSSSGFSRIS